MAFQIGPLALAAPVFLAPMSGVTDKPFRTMVRRFGAPMVSSEMIASREMIEAARSSPKASLDYRDETPVAAQLAGCEPEMIAEAAKLNADRGASLIDLNFGCPVKKVVSKMAGSALMRDEILATRLMEAAVKAVDIPVTVKMRLGWDDQSLNAPRLAKLAEESGIRMITVHGRTRQQMYGGTARWDDVRAVKAAVSIPVIVNGDITSADRARTALAQSGADGVMIGRGAYGRPWIIAQIAQGLANHAAGNAPALDVRRDALLDHHTLLLSYYGTVNGTAIARKHIGWALDPLPGGREAKAAIVRLDDPAAVRGALQRFFDDLAASGRAGELDLHDVDASGSESCGTEA